MLDRIIFLDYDGVVNTPIWMNYKRSDGSEYFTARYAWPHDGFVNNFQAICWLNELYKKYPYDIVVTSSWRMDCRKTTYQECLYNGGLSKDINILGCVDDGYARDLLIEKWLSDNNYTGRYIILDDDNYYCDSNLKDRVVLTDADIGITVKDYHKMERLFNET